MRRTSATPRRAVAARSLASNPPPAARKQTSHGRRVVLTIFVGNVPIPASEDFDTIVADQAKMIEAVYRYL